MREGTEEQYPSSRLIHLSCAFVAIISLVKGFAMAPHPYALGQHLYTYERGFLIRGLWGQFHFLLFGNNWHAIKQAVNITSVFTSLGLIACLLYLLVRRYNTRSAPFLFLLAASGPLFVTIGATRGYFDAQLLILGLLSYITYKDEKYLPSVLVFCVALLIHEMVAVFILPIFLTDLIEKEKPEVIKRLSVIFILTAATIFTVIAGKATEEQWKFIAGKTAQSEEMFSDGWEQYQKTTLMAAQRPVEKKMERPPLQKALNRVNELKPYLIANFAIIVVFSLALGTDNKRSVLMMVGIACLPLLIQLFAYDRNRFLALATFTSLMVGLNIFSRNPQYRLPAGLKVVILTISLWQLLFNYDVVAQYARDNTLMQSVALWFGF